MGAVSIFPSPAVTTATIPPSRVRVRVRVRASLTVPLARSVSLRFGNIGRKPSSPLTRPNAGLTEVEPDLEEDKRDPWRTNGVLPEDFKYGEYDGHHTYHEGNEGSFWEAVVADYEAMEPPTGFQGLMSWLFLPAVGISFAYHVPGDYIYIGAAVFVVVFCAIEMGKPDKPHNFEPQIYNMERGARDKVISDYNTMDIWDFNEKYGELWDFTLNTDDIYKQIK